MRLTRIELRDFLGYEALDLDLSGLSSLVVAGENMAGKSTLLDAVTWALFDQFHRPGVRSVDRLVRDGAEVAHVRIEFIVGDHLIEVIREKPRGKTGTLALVVDGSNQTQHTTAETFKAIEKWVGLPLDALLAGPFMVQKQSDAFMAAQPRDRKDLLIHLLGLDAYEELHERAKQKRDEAESDYRAAEARAADASAVIVGGADLPARLGDAEQSLAAARDDAGRYTATLTDLRGKIAETSADKVRLADLTAQVERVVETSTAVRGLLQAAQARRTELQADLGPEPIVMEFSEQVLEEAWDEVHRQDEAKDAFERLQREITAADADLTRANTAAEIIGTVPCGGKGKFAACRFLVEAVAARDDIPNREHAVFELVQRRDAMDMTKVNPKAARTEAMRLQEQKRLVTEQVGQRDLWHEQATHRKQMLDDVEDRIAEYAQRIDTNVALAETLRGNLEPLREAEDNLERLARERTEVEASLAEANAIVIAANERLQPLLVEKGAVERARQAQDEARQAMVAANERAYTYRLLALAFHRNGIPTNIIEGTIPRIEEAANDVLSRLPGDLRLSLRTQREKATGGMADTLDVVVETDGWEREYGMLSVGGRFRVDLALRLGLGRVLAHRTGAKIETLWLDEPLADLDAASRSAVVETLNALADEFALMVVVSHADEVNDLFPNVLSVSMDGGVSSAVLA